MKKIITGALALMLFTVAAQAQTRDTIRHHKGNHEMMAKQINLTADQQAKLKSIHESERSEMKSLKNSSLTTEQQQAKRQELRKKYSEQEQLVYTPEQKEQMQKMKTKWKQDARKGKKDGKKGMENGHKGGDMAKELNLSQDQKDRMEKMRAASKPQFEAVRNDKTLSEDQKKAKLQELRKQQQQEMKNILTPEQVEKMKTLREQHGKKNTK